MQSASKDKVFTPEAALKIAREFGIVDQSSRLHELISRTTNAYKASRLDPKYNQQKDALEKFRKVLLTVEKLATKREQTLRPGIEDTLLPFVGELLSDEGLERLLGQHVAKPVIAPISRMQKRDAEEQSMLNRAVHASRAGPKLVAALFAEMRRAVEMSLARFRPVEGGRPTKHEFRAVILIALAWDYPQLFDRRPTSSPEGHFDKFCRAVLDEMKMDTVGLSKAITVVLKKLGYLPIR